MGATSMPSSFTAIATIALAPTSLAAEEADRNGRGGRLGRERRRGAPGRSDDRHLAAHQIGGEARQPILPAVTPAVLDRDVLALGTARFGEALAERGAVGRLSVQVADDGH